ncbi:MAG TPA: hypothetical protein PK402_01035 [Tepidisphaeraceae bacterium]|nr:hypothetical protein [Tepidisphaeraceae bacterium]
MLNTTWLNAMKLLMTLSLLLNVNASCFAADAEDGDETAEVDDSESRESWSKEISDEGEVALKESDKGVDEDGEKVSKMEALEYYDEKKHPENRTFEMSREWARGFTEKAYKAGAEKVWVTRISEDEIEGHKIRMSDDLLIVLPADAAKRKAIFELWNGEVEDEELKLVDVGQKYIFYVAD